MPKMQVLIYCVLYAVQKAAASAQFLFKSNTVNQIEQWIKFQLCSFKKKLNPIIETDRALNVSIGSCTVRKNFNKYQYWKIRIIITLIPIFTTSLFKKKFFKILSFFLKVQLGLSALRGAYNGLLTPGIKPFLCSTIPPHTR